MNDKTIVPRFWSKVEMGAGCWLWRAAKTSCGYGHIGIGKKRTENAQRVAWRLTFGAIPSGMYVLHHCDNRLCVNPDHLFLGTHRDNMIDMARKGRDAVHANPDTCSQKGEGNGNSKLSTDQVQQIRKLYDTGSWTRLALARKFGVARVTIAGIVTRNKWKHLP